MEQTRFEVRLAQAEHPSGCIVGDKRYKFDGKGMDDVEFMMSANPGQPRLRLAGKWHPAAKRRASCCR